MSRRLFIAFLITLPFWWLAAFAYANWVEPTATPPGDNLPGPVWFLPLASLEQQANGKINISGSITSGGSVTSGNQIIAQQAIITPTSGNGVLSTINISDTSAVRGDALAPAIRSAAIAGFGYGTPPAAGAWAGYFAGYVYAEKYCVPGAAPTDPPNCTGGPGGPGGPALWTLAADGHSIYKTDPTLVTAIGTTTTTGFPAGTKLAVVTASSTDAAARIFVDGQVGTGNPEIDLKFGSGDHWALYADKTSPNNLTFWRTSNLLSITTAGQLQGASGSVSAPAYSFTGDTNTGLYSGGADILKLATGGVDRVTVTPTGNVGIGVTDPQSSLDLGGALPVMTFRGWAPVSITLTVAKSGTGTGTVTSNETPTPRISCGGTCSASYGGGSTVTLTATATSPAIFAGWSFNVAGVACNEGNASTICTFTMPAQNTTVTATFSSPAAPTVTTLAATSVTGTSATLNGSAIPNGNATVATFKWDTSFNGCTGLTKIITPQQSIGSGFSIVLFDNSAHTGTSNETTGLLSGTTYYFCAIATNSAGTRVGTVLSFTTTVAAPTAPTVTSPTATSITSSSATLGANVTSDGGTAVTARGTCWGTTLNPTTNCLSQGTGPGIFTHTRTGLSPSTLYHYRGYATNSVGTSYTADATFTTSSGGSFLLTVGKDASDGLGSITGTLSCNDACAGPVSGSFAAGTAISLTATPAAGSFFSGWINVTGIACTLTNGGRTCSFTMPSNPVSLDAVFTIL